MKTKLINLIAILLFISIYFIPTTSYSDYGNNRGYRGGRGGRPGGVSHPNGGFKGHGNGYIGHPVHFVPGPMPRGGWRGNGYVYAGRTYFVWGWTPYAPFYAWPYYYGWHPYLYYYIPEGLICYSDNQSVPGIWTGQVVYYTSDDAINSALGFCENDPRVIEANLSNLCRIRNCTQF